MIKLITTIIASKDGKSLRITQRSEQEEETAPEVLLANILVEITTRLTEDASGRNKKDKTK